MGHPEGHRGAHHRQVPRRGHREHVDAAARPPAAPGRRPGRACRAGGGRAAPGRRRRRRRRAAPPSPPARCAPPRRPRNREPVRCTRACASAISGSSSTTSTRIVGHRPCTVAPGRRTREQAAAVVRRPHVVAAAVPADDLPDQRQAEAAAGALGGPAAPERVGHRVRGQPGAAVGDPDQHARRRPRRRSTRTRRGAGVPATASRALSTRLPTTVSRSPARQRAVVEAATSGVDRPAPRRARRPAPTCPAAARPAPARSTAPTTRSVSCWASASSAVAEPTASSVRPSSIRVSTVCSRLAASWACARSASVSAAHRVQLAGQRPQLGVVAQGQHGAERRALEAGRPLVDHQHPVAGEDRLVAGRRARRRAARPTAGGRSTRRPAGRSPARPRRARAGGAASSLTSATRRSAVEHQQALADRVQDGVVVLVHPGHLAPGRGRGSGGAAGG